MKNRWFLLFHLCKKGPIFHRMRWSFLRKHVLFFNKWYPINPQSPFGGESSIPIYWPMNAMSWPTRWNGKAIWRTLPFIMSKQHYNSWKARQLLVVTFKPPSEVPTFIFWWIYKILCGETSNNRQYEVTIVNFPTCTYMDFVTMNSSSMGKQGKWVPCKHMYYVL